MTEEYLKEKTKEMMKVIAPATFLQRLFSRQVSETHLKNLLSEVYGKGFSDGASIVTSQLGRRL